ncbi:MAG: hypothetical protein JOZ16_00065 [Methylobacteriaceae bacterium]|nr:hypothetical protein [Methylobacteriaceae bacterium]
MKKFLVFSALSLSLLSVGPAFAIALAANGTFVQPSSSGAFDSGDCSTPQQPCRTITYALSQTPATGQVNIVGPADFYESLTITQGVTLYAVDSDVRLVPPSGQAGITINAAITDNVNLRGFQIVGTAGGANGIVANSVSKLALTNMSIAGFNSGVGINFSPNTAGSNFPVLYMQDSIVRYNNGNILISPTNSVGASADLKRSTSQFAATYGVRADGSSTAGQVQVTISDSEITNVTNNGILAVSNGSMSRIMVDHTIVAHMGTNGVTASGTGAQVLMNNSTITFSNNAILAQSGGTVQSYGNNAVNFDAGNTTFSGSQMLK